MGNEDITSIERQIFDLTTQLNELRKANTGEVIPNYRFTTLDGEVSLLDMFGDKDKLLLIHNMGEGCRYCTLWADGFNGFVPHLESVMPVFLVSKDSPAAQRQFANSRGWRFRLASHAGGDYIREQSVMEGSDNMPGAVVYTRSGDEIRRKIPVFSVQAIIFAPCGACSALPESARMTGHLNTTTGSARKPSMMAVKTCSNRLAEIRPRSLCGTRSLRSTIKDPCGGVGL